MRCDVKFSKSAREFVSWARWVTHNVARDELIRRKRSWRVDTLEPLPINDRRHHHHRQLDVFCSEARLYLYAKRAYLYFACCFRAVWAEPFRCPRASKLSTQSVFTFDIGWAELTAPPKGLRECLRELNTKWKFIECRWLWFRLRRRFFQNNKLPVTERKGHHGTSENFDSRMLISSRVYFIFSATSPHQIVCYSAVLTLSLLQFPGYRSLHSDDRRRWLPASTTCNFVLVGRGQQRVWTVWEPLFSEHECKMWRETACWQVVEHGRDTPDMWERESRGGMIS